MERVKSFLKVSGDLKHQVAETLSGDIFEGSTLHTRLFIQWR